MGGVGVGGGGGCCWWFVCMWREIEGVRWWLMYLCGREPVPQTRVLCGCLPSHHMALVAAAAGKAAQLPVPHPHPLMCPPLHRLLPPPLVLPLHKRHPLWRVRAACAHFSHRHPRPGLLGCYVPMCHSPTYSPNPRLTHPCFLLLFLVDRIGTFARFRFNVLTLLPVEQSFPYTYISFHKLYSSTGYS